MLRIIIIFKIKLNTFLCFTPGLNDFGELPGKSICYVEISYLGTKICSKITDLSSVKTEHVTNQLNKNTAWQQWLLLPLLSRFQITRMSVCLRITYILGYLFHTCGFIFLLFILVKSSILLYVKTHLRSHLQNVSVEKESQVSITCHPCKMSSNTSHHLI